MVFPSTFLPGPCLSRLARVRITPPATQGLRREPLGSRRVRGLAVGRAAPLGLPRSGASDEPSGARQGSRHGSGRPAAAGPLGRLAERGREGDLPDERFL